MIPSELYQQLQKTYQIVCFIDLADITQSPDSVYKLFSEHYKIEYKENERLVFYTNQTPSAKLVTHIRQAASVIDISNCFILICCPYNLNLKRRKDMLQQIQVNCESAELKDNYALPEIMCALPFSHLEINHQGFVKPCCVYKTHVGRVPAQSIKEIYYSDKMTQLRNNFLNGVKSDNCSTCWSVEAQGQISFRQASLKFYKNKLYTTWITNPDIRSLDLKLSNVCNFKCRICNPRASSLYAGEQLANSTNPQTKINIQNLIDSSSWFENDKKFIQEFEELLGQIENLNFYGGEPFLLKNLPKVLKTAVNINYARHIRLHFNTNGSIFPKNLVDLFKEFKQIDLAISLDCIGSRFEYQRGGTWAAVAENIKKLNQLHSEKINVYLFPTVNIQNVLYLDEVYTWAHEHNLNIFLNFLEEPKFLNIDYMTPEANELVIDKFQNSKILELRNISAHLKQSHGDSGQEFREYMQKLDNWRNENFSLTHPEIANAMRYVL